MKRKVKAFFKRNPNRLFKRKSIANLLNIETEHDYSALKAILYTLEKEKFIEKVGKRFEFNAKNENVKLIGTLQVTSAGYGFVVPQNSSFNDVFVQNKNLFNSLDGDKVEVLIVGNSGKNYEGKIIENKKRGRNIITGTLIKNKNKFTIVPDDDKIHVKFNVNSKILNGTLPNDRVVIEEYVWEKTDKRPTCKKISVFNYTKLKQEEVVAIAHKFNLPYLFNSKIKSEIKTVKSEITKEEIKKRIDLREKNIFTIDPEDAKDFDDALSVEQKEDGVFEVGIHIADVSHYVMDNTEIDSEAKKRGNSVYLVGNVVPMLPEKISNNICSLVPNKDRLTFSIFIKMSKNGKTLNFKIKKSVINSCKRFSYQDVQNIIDNKKGEYYNEIMLLNNLAKKLKKQRLSEGSIEFYTPEVKIELNEGGIPINVIMKKFMQSNSLVEEFMLLANKLIAEFINSKNKKGNIPFVYRVHDLPKKDKVVDFAKFVNSLGYKFDPNSSTKVNKFQELITKSKGTEEATLINELAIRSMAKAVYTSKNIGHYGLGFKYYTHFTSPIRRYADLVVHRILFHYLTVNEKSLYDKSYLDNLCEHLSDTERSAVDAERYSTKLKQVEYLKEHIGEEFTCIISGIIHFGIFVKLIDILSEGFVRLKDMKDDYYIYDEKTYSLYGERTKKRYRLGDKIKVKLKKVDLEKTEIDFIIVK